MRLNRDAQTELDRAHFNPRTREGCDLETGVYASYGWLISIHAPVKGATERQVHRVGIVFISIHAPVKGAT